MHFLFATYLHGSIQYFMSLILCIYNILEVNNFPDDNSSCHLYINNRVGIHYFLTWSSLVRQFFHSMKNILLLKTKYSNTLALNTAISYQDAPLKHFQRVHLQSCHSQACGFCND